ncbi:MAG: hypothetical protein ACYDCK_00600 [Thermoplasmatota archaeon]
MLAAFVVSPVLSGCLKSPTGAPLTANGAADGAPLVTLKLPIHVVFVGFPAGLVDEKSFVARLPANRSPFNELRASTTGSTPNEPLAYALDYHVHDASAAFASALFGYAASIAKPAKADSFLAGYDATTTGHAHACTPAASPTPVPLPVATPLDTPPACKDVEQIPADTLEAWIAANRGAYGLDFGANGAFAGYTLFLLDSWSNGYLPKDTYHEYAIDDHTGDLALTGNQRAWGGEHDFVFFDPTAAPDFYDDHPWAVYTVADGASGAQDEDKPLWDLAASPDVLEKNLARNVADAVSILWARNPIYFPEYAPHYDFPLTVFIDPAAHTNPNSPLYGIAPADIKNWTDTTRLQAALAGVVARSSVKSEVKFVFLPTDDMGMFQALQDAKHRASPTSVDFGVLKHYLRENWAQYVPKENDTRVYPEFVFWLEYPSTSFFAYSDGDEWGDSWGVFTNVADMRLCPLRAPPSGPACLFGGTGPSPQFAQVYQEVLLHELGHSLSLTHTHDTSHYDSKGYSTYDVNWLWDSTASSMTYRHFRLSFDQFDRDYLARAQASWLAQGALQRDPSNVDAKDAVARLARGETVSALDAALKARNATMTLPAPAIDAKPLAPTTTMDLVVPASGTLVGDPPYVSPMPIYAPNPLALVYQDQEGATKSSFTYKVPDGTKRLEIRWEETTPVNALRSAWLDVTTAQGRPVGGAYNNGFDVVELTDTWRCEGSCVISLHQYAGVAGEFTVTVTPFASAERTTPLDVHAK